MPKVNLLLTRPQNAAEKFARSLPDSVRARMNLCLVPLIEIVPMGLSVDLSGAMGVVFSSTNGVMAASGQTARRDLTAYCVGKATTEAARRAGWPARMMGETAEALVDAMAASGVSGPVVHLSGCHVRGDIAARLTAAGCRACRQPVYDQKLLDLGAAARDVIAGGGPIIAPLFSPRTAQRLVDQCPSDARLHLIALSPAVAEPLKKLQFSRVFLCERPDANSMACHIGKVLSMLCRVEGTGGAQ